MEHFDNTEPTIFNYLFSVNKKVLLPRTYTLYTVYIGTYKHIYIIYMGTYMYIVVACLRARVYDSCLEKIARGPYRWNL